MSSLVRKRPLYTVKRNYVLTSYGIDSCLNCPKSTPADLLLSDYGDAAARDRGYTVAQSPGKGMGLFATRLIPAGAKILDEKPVLTLPAGGGDGNQVLQPSDLHAFAAQFFDLSPALREAVTNLQGERVALWRPQMEYYQNILNKDEFPVTKGKDGMIAHRPLNSEERSQLEHVLRVFYTNAAALVAPLRTSRSRAGRAAHVGDGLFLTFSRINHSCEANAVWDTCQRPGIMSIRAARDIQPGEEITISYFWETAEAVEERRERTKGWGFVCQCLKCGPVAWKE